MPATDLSPLTADDAPAEALTELGVLGVEVQGLSAAAALGVAVERRRRADREAAEEMRAVCHFTDLHRTDDLLDAAIDPELQDVVLGREGHGEEAELRLAGVGTFMVTEFAVSELAAGLGMSEPAARAYVGQSIELRDRLCGLWAEVMSGRLPAWKARLVAKETIPLSPEAARYVDAQLAPFAARISPWRIVKAVESAILRHDPELAAERARAAAEKRGVWVEHHLDGVSELRAVGDTPDVTAFDHAVDTVATALGALGDTDPRHVRRAKAIGVLADPQCALGLHTTATDPATDPATSAEHRPATTSGTLERPVVHLHLHTDAVERGAGGVARVGGLGPRALASVRRWLADLAPGAVVELTPVVDVGEHISVDAYEAPDRLRTQVEHRDTCCVFPWCGRVGRHDLDHIQEYVDPADGGPPGQTNSDNLARLCRFHHRVKTHPGIHGRWDYRRQPDRSLIWTSPLGRSYRVDHRGTTNLD